MVFSKAPIIAAVLFASTVIPLLGSEAIPWKPAGISSPLFESHAAFDPRTIGPLFSPSGRSLLFARDTKGPDSGEFYVWHESGAEAWPRGCPAR